MAAATLTPPQVEVDLSSGNSGNSGNGQTPGLLDVRTPAEFTSVRIPGSHNIPLSDLDSVADRLAAASRPLVVVCQSGQRSQQAQQRLLAAGVDDVHVLEGGLRAWQRHGGEVERGEQKWELERQVRLVAGSLVLAGVLGSRLVDERLKYIAGFVGAGLTFAALSNTCAMANVLSRLPYNRGPGADVEASIRALVE